MHRLGLLFSFAGCASAVGGGDLDPTRSYDDRLEMLALLADAHPYPAAGTDDAWPDHRAGIAQQTAWQARSGRSTTDADGRVDGWWPNVNWTLTVWQFQAQQRYRGDFADLWVVMPDDDRFELPEDVGRRWADYYAEIDRARDDVAAGRLTPRQESDRAQVLQRMMWDVHMAAVREGLARNRDREVVIAEGENQFAAAWGHTAVDFIAVANLPSDAETIGRMQALLLPDRLITPQDYDVDGPADLTWHQHMALHAMATLRTVEALSGGELMRRWSTALAEPRCAALCPYLLDQALAEDLADLPGYLYDVVDWAGGVDDRPAWAATGASFDCTATGDGSLNCSREDSGARSYRCTVAGGVREWTCRSCLADRPGTALFARLFCPDGTTTGPDGQCEVLEAGAFASGSCPE